MPCAFCARKTIFYNSTDKFLKKQLLRLWQCRGDTSRTDPLSVQSYRVCQKVSLTVAYLLAMFIISQVVSLSCLLTINFMCQQRFFRFPQKRMRLSIVQKRFWLCIRLSLFFAKSGFFFFIRVSAKGTEEWYEGFVWKLVYKQKHYAIPRTGLAWYV